MYTNSSLTRHVVSGLFDASVLYFVLPSKSDGYMADLQRPNTDNKIEYKLVNSMQVSDGYISCRYGGTLLLHVLQQKQRLVIRVWQLSLVADSTSTR